MRTLRMGTIEMLHHYFCFNRRDDINNEETIIVCQVFDIG